MVRIASYNVENLFARPKVFRTNDWSTSEPILAAYEEVNALFQADTYSDQDKANIKRLLVELDIYVVNANGAVTPARAGARGQPDLRLALRAATRMAHSADAVRSPATRTRHKGSLKVANPNR